MSLWDTITEWLRKPAQLSPEVERIARENPEEFQRYYQQVTGQQYVPPPMPPKLQIGPQSPFANMQINANILNSDLFQNGTQPMTQGFSPVATQQRETGQEAWGDTLKRTQDYLAAIRNIPNAIGQYAQTWGNIPQQIEQQPDWQKWLGYGVPATQLLTSPIVQKLAGDVARGQANITSAAIGGRPLTESLEEWSAREPEVTLPWRINPFTGEPATISKKDVALTVTPDWLIGVGAPMKFAMKANIISALAKGISRETILDVITKTAQLGKKLKPAEAEKILQIAESEIAKVAEKAAAKAAKKLPITPPVEAQAAQKVKAMQWVEDEGIVDLSGKPIDVNPDGTVTLYHRTTQEAADQMNKTGKFISKENTNETFFSNKPTGQAEGYGDVIVTVKVPARNIRLDDAFKGEIHVAIDNSKLGKASIIEAQTAQKARELITSVEELPSVKKAILNAHSKLTNDMITRRISANLQDQSTLPIHAVQLEKYIIEELGSDPIIRLYRGSTVPKRTPMVGTSFGKYGDWWTTDVKTATEYARGGDIFTVDVKASELANRNLAEIVGGREKAYILFKDLQNRAQKAGEAVITKEPYIYSTGGETPRYWVKGGETNYPLHPKSFATEAEAKEFLAGTTPQAVKPTAGAVEGAAKGGIVPPSTRKLSQLPAGEGATRESEHFRKVNERLNGELGENPIYNKVNLSDQSAKAIQFVADNPDDARRIALGYKNPPEGLLDTAISTAYEQKMFDAGDIKGYTKVVNALSLRKTRAGQEIAALRGVVNDNSPTHFVQQVIAERVNRVGSKLPKLAGEVDTPASRVVQAVDKEKARLNKLVTSNKIDQTEAERLMDKFIYQLGTDIKPEEVTKIKSLTQELEGLFGKVDPVLGIPDSNYWVARKKLDDYINGLNPAHQLRVATSISGRGAMLFSIKSPLTNIISNTVMAGIQGFQRRITNKAYRGLNGDFALQYVKKVNQIFQKSGYDISRLDSLWPGQVRLGEEMTTAQGPGIVRKVGRFYEDVVFKQLMGAPDVASSSIAFADSMDLMTSRIAKAEGLADDAAKTRALDIFKDAIKVDPTTPEGVLARAQAIADARFTTYTNQSGYSDIAMGIRKLLNKMSGDIRIGDQLMPFVKTPANVVSAAIDAAGVGVFKGLYKLPKAIKAMKAGEPALMKEAVGDFTRAGLGLTLATVLAYSINPDDFVGDYDSLGVKEREMAALKNAPYNSIRVGDKWISLDYLGPLASAFIGIMYARKYGSDLPTKIAKYTQGAAGQLLRFPGLTEISDMIANIKEAAASGDYGKTVTGLTDELVAFIRARVIPAIVSDSAKALDTKERTTGKSTLARTMAGIPGLRQMLPEKVERTTGQFVPTENPILTLLFGSRLKTARDNAVISEIDRLYGVDATPTIRDIEKSSTKVQKLKSQIGEDRFVDALQFYGQTYGNKTTQEMMMPSYRALSDEDKMKRLNSLRSDAVDDMIRKYQKTEIVKPQSIQSKINDAGYYIESQIWSQYPPQTRILSEQIIKLENSDSRTDKIQARQLLMQHPEILMARRLIAQQKALLKRQLLMQGVR